MKKIKVLKVTFDGEVAGHEIPAFRGAIARKAGFENFLFHNHLGDGFRYRYPLIQYKRLGRQPAIVCVGEGMEQVYKFFEKRDWSIDISGRTLNMEIERLDMNQFNMQVWNQQFTYQMYNWIALNQKTYPEYMELDSLVDQITFLEKKLVGNILSFAKGIDWYIEKQVTVWIKDLGEAHKVRLKGIPFIGFPVRFSTNVFLPEGLGLGKGVSVGYGVIKRPKRHNQPIIAEA